MKPKRNKIEKEEKRITRRLFFAAMASGLLCIGLLVGTLFYFFVPRDNDAYILTVPSFVGKNEGEVKGDSDLEITREWIYSSTAPKGRIISQEPFGGARRKLRTGEKYEVKIYVSLGEQTERIPDLSGVGINSAAAALRAIHAKVRSVAVYDSGEDGVVLYTSPAANRNIKAGDTVTVFVARQRPIGSVRVPDLCGMPLCEAYRIALASGLFVTNGEPNELQSIVTRQSIPAGSMVKRGSYISFMSDEATEENIREWPPVTEWADTEESSFREDRE
jgi:hypothetical protein